jgi:hypothetical protein
MTIDEAREMVMSAQARLIRVRQELRQVDAQLSEADNLLELLVKRLAPPEGEAAADGGPTS